MSRTREEADAVDVIQVPNGSGWLLVFFAKVPVRDIDPHVIARGSMSWDWTEVDRILFATEEDARAAHRDWNLVRDAERRLGGAPPPDTFQRTLGESDAEFRTRIKQELGL